MDYNLYIWNIKKRNRNDIERIEDKVENKRSLKEYKDSFTGKIRATKAIGR